VGKQQAKTIVRTIGLASLALADAPAAKQQAPKSGPSPTTLQRRGKQPKREKAPGSGSDVREIPRRGRDGPPVIKAVEARLRTEATAVRRDPTASRITVSVPLSVAPRGGRKTIISPVPVEYMTARPQPDNALLKALARAHRWRRLIETGQYASITDLAHTEKVNQSYACRVLRLTLLAPGIIEAILDGRQPAGLHLATVLRPIPSEWEKQSQLYRMTS